MDRRDSLKSMLIGGITGGLILSGCQPVPGEDKTETPPANADGAYGRTPKEKEVDAKLRAQTFFTPEELGTIAVLCDLILPASADAGSATDAGVPDFIEFIVKDITEHQTPVRGGLMWLNNRAMKLHGKGFSECTGEQQRAMLDAIAWPDKSTPETQQGVEFFSRMRNLVLTGYYTSEMGIKDLGYAGNTPNVWDGVPDDVLQKHGLSYDEAWLSKCIDQETRNTVAQWDENGKLMN